MGIYTPNTEFTDDFYEKGRYILAHRVSFFFALIFGLLAVLFSVVDTTIFLLYLLVFALSVFNMIYLKNTRNSTVVFWIFTILGSVMLIYVFNFIIYTLHYSDLMWIICLILFAFIGLPYRYAYLILGIHGLSITYFVVFRLNTHIETMRTLGTIELGITGFELMLTFAILAFLIDQNIKYQSYTKSQLEEVNQALRIQNNENVTLLREIHHRVKNNLQIVVSLLRIQKEELDNEEAKKHFRTAIDRVLTISLIHKKLYEFGELSRIDIRTYLQQLIDEIGELHEDEVHLQIHLETKIDKFNAKSMVPLGLIINELITNSVKYAIESISKNEITITLKQLNHSHIELIYDDKGSWNTNNTAGFGSELLVLLTEQLEGELVRKDSKYYLKFPLDDI